MGQFLPLFLQFGASAAKLAAQIAAARTVNKTFMPFFMTHFRLLIQVRQQKKIALGRMPSRPLQAGGHLIMD
jgi:hypothetical protein